MYLSSLVSKGIELIFIPDISNLTLVYKKVDTNHNSVTCSGTDGLSWFKGNEEIGGTNNAKVFQLPQEAGTRIFFGTSIELSDSGTYTCKDDSTVKRDLDVYVVDPTSTTTPIGLTTGTKTSFSPATNTAPVSCLPLPFFRRKSAMKATETTEREKKQSTAVLCNNQYEEIDLHTETGTVVHQLPQNGLPPANPVNSGPYEEIDLKTENIPPDAVTESDGGGYATLNHEGVKMPTEQVSAGNSDYQKLNIEQSIPNPDTYNRLYKTGSVEPPKESETPKVDLYTTVSKPQPKENEEQ